MLVIGAGLMALAGIVAFSSRAGSSWSVAGAWV